MNEDEDMKIAQAVGIYKPGDRIPRQIPSPYLDGYEKGKQEMAKIVTAFGLVALIIVAIAVWWITADMRMATIVNNAPSPAEMHEILGNKQ